MPVTDFDRRAAFGTQAAVALAELGLPPGRALTLGQESLGAARWLADQGWRVTAILDSQDLPEMPGVEVLALDPYGDGELAPLEEQAYDLAVALGGFDRALTTLHIDSLLYGLARVLKRDGRILATVRTDAAPPLQESARIPSGDELSRETVQTPVPEDDPDRPEELSALIPLVRVRRTYADGFEEAWLERLWEMSEVHQVAHRCLIELGRRWRNHRPGVTLLEMRIPGPL